MSLEEFSTEEIPYMSVEALLDSLDLAVMKDNMIQQIKRKVSSQQNFLSVVIEKFEKIDKNVNDNDTRREITYEIIDFCREIILVLVDEYGMFYDDNYGNSKDVIEVLGVLYNFFVLRVKSHVSEFLISYIQKNKTPIMTSIEEKLPEEKTIDITTISNEKKNISKDNVWILSHIDSIINFVSSVDISPDEFLETINDGDFYIEKLIEYFAEDKLGGDFVSQYIRNIVDDYSSDVATEVRNTVRLAFLS